MLRKTLAVLVVSLVAASAAAAGSAASEAPGASDVRSLAKTLEEHHPNLFRHVRRARFRAEVERVARVAPRLEANELLVGLMRIAALAGPRNGHTGVFPLVDHRRELHLYPLRLYDFADAVRVVDHRTQADDLLGARLVSVAGVPVERVLAQVRPLVPRDNEWSLRGQAPHYALVAEVLDGLGVIERRGPAVFGFERVDGDMVELALTPIAGREYGAAFADPLHGHYPSALPSRPQPLFLANAGRELWLTKLAGGRAVYVGYNAVLPDTEAVANRLVRLARNSRVRRVVVDVRLNGGGNNRTYLPLLNALGSPALNRRGRLYLLFGRATFSAAGNFATDVEQHTRAISIGEPTGGGVNQYGDAVAVTLPATGVVVYVATSYVARADESDRRLAVTPDRRVDLTSTDFLAGRDPVLAAALKGL